MFSLFCDLNVADDLLEYPLFFSSGKDGWVKSSHDGEKEGFDKILDKIIEYIPPPKVGDGNSFEMLVS